MGLMMGRRRAAEAKKRKADELKPAKVAAPPVKVPETPPEEPKAQPAPLTYERGDRKEKHEAAANLHRQKERRLEK